MEIQEYLNKKIEFHNLLLSFIENEDTSNEVAWASLISFYSNLNILQNKEEFKLILQLILIISNYHYRYLNFFDKIDQILNYLKNDIQQIFTNYEIFDFFKENKRVLLSLIKNGTIVFDPNIINYILTEGDVNDPKFSHYFFPEIQNYITNQMRQSIRNNFIEKYSDFPTNFDEKRQNGENESYLCSLIRNDSVEEFISFSTRQNLSLFTQINSSLFETNLFLIENKPDLIEYAAYFGSIQIFQYLRMNGVELRPSIWLYSIHGRNAEIIHLIEDDHILPPNETYEKLLEESIKCHHNEIANYIKNNLISQENYENFHNFYSYCFHYHNYEYLPNNLCNRFIFYYLCQYNYYDLVKIYLDKEELNVYETIILIHFSFYHIFFLFMFYVVLI